MPDAIYEHVLPAVRLIMQELTDAPDAAGLEQRVHARLWPYVTHAVRDIVPSAMQQPAPKRDGRAKSWQYVVRFWHVTPIGNDLYAESDTEIMQGTGALQQIIPHYSSEVHDGYIAAELQEEAIKKQLNQLRNNLGRQGKAVLRIPHDVGDEKFICQVDIVALDA